MAEPFARGVALTNGRTRKRLDVRNNGSAGRPTTLLDLEVAVEHDYQRIRSAALAKTRNPWDADDLAQETFLEAIRFAGQFNGDAEPYTWLYAILLNRERRWCRRNHRLRQRLKEGGTLKDAPQSVVEGPEECIEAQEWAQMIRRQMAQLSADQRRVLILHYWKGLSYEEIGARMGCAVGTVKSRLHRALERLRAGLSKVTSEESNPNGNHEPTPAISPAVEDLAQES